MLFLLCKPVSFIPPSWRMSHEFNLACRYCATAMYSGTVNSLKKQQKKDDIFCLMLFDGRPRMHCCGRLVILLVTVCQI